MRATGIRVLLLDGGGRQAMPVLNGLHKMGCSITTLNSSKLDIGYASRYPQNKLLYEGIDHNIEKLTSAIEELIMSGNYDVIIPLGDITTEFLTKNWDKFSGCVSSFVPNYETFMKAYDKQITMEICQAEGIPCTRTKYLSESIDEFLDRVGGFPIVVKPRSACGSMGFHCIKSREEFDILLESGEINYTDCVIQEYVNQDGAQYNVHAFMDGNGEVSYIVATEKCRWFPVDGGSSCFCRTIDRPDLIEQCTKLLKAVNWRGCCEVELIQDIKTGEAKVMEINGRTSACVKICQLVGVNIAKNMVETALGEEVTNQSRPYHDVRMRCIHTDILWFIKSSKRLNTKPGWFNNSHTHDQIFAIDDPWPFFTFSIQSLMRYKTEMKKRSR